jgi:hypothetical protein
VVADPDGTPWAVGADYKAALRPGAVEFVPALGSAVPHNRTLTLRLQTIHHGVALLHATTAPLPMPRIGGNDVTYERGAVVERWRVAARGLEQSFVFAARPAGDGDLIVRSAVQGELQAETLADGTLQFTDGRVGGVHIGAVTGIDARGEHCRGSVAMVDGQLELRLPDAFVDRAMFPLILDPWVSTAALVPTGAGDDGQVRGALRPINNGEFEVWAFCRTFSASDSDIYSLSSDYPTPLVAIANTVNVIETLPALAIANAAPFPAIVAWQERTQPSGPWTVKARHWYPGTPQSGGVATVASNVERPSLCSNRTGAALLLAYLDPAVGIITRTLSPVLFTSNPPALGAATTAVTLTSGNTIVAGPQLSDSIASGSTAALIFEVNIVLTGTSSLNVLAIGPTGAVLASTTLILANGANFDPAIGGNGSHFRAVYTRFGQLLQQDVLWNGTTLTPQPFATLDASGPGKRPSITWCGDRYLTTWGRATAIAGDDEVVVQTSLPDGTVLGAQPTQAAPTVVQPNQQNPHALSGWATGGAGQRATVVWSETPVGGGSSSACTRTYLVMQGSPSVNLGGSCIGQSCTSLLPCGYTQGAFSPGNQTFQMRLQYQDQTAPLALLNLAVSGPAPIGCGTCQLMVPLVTQVMANAPGELAYTWPLPFNYAALGFPLEFQWVMFGTASSPCPLVPNVVAYNRVRVLFAE